VRDEWRGKPDMNGAYELDIHALSVEYGFPAPNVFDSLISEAISREVSVEDYAVQDSDEG
jgi:hypothetical protein